MFYQSGIQSWNIPLQNLTGGLEMFAECESLESFAGSLESLEEGGGMFEGCSSLTEFDSTLPVVNSASDMFFDCRLSYESGLRVLNSLPVANSVKGISIGFLGVDQDGHTGCLVQDASGSYRVKQGLMDAITNAEGGNWNVAVTYYDRIGPDAEPLEPVS